MRPVVDVLRGVVRRTWTVGALLLAAAAALSYWTAATQGASSTVSLVPSDRSLDVNDALSVDVRATGLTNLGAYEFAVEYDASVLQFVKADHSAFLGGTGRTPSCPQPVQIDQNASDSVEVMLFGCASSGTAVEGPSGDAVLVSMQFKAVADGKSDLLFRKVELALPSGDTCCQIGAVKETSVSVGGGAVPPTPRPDLTRLTPTPPPGAALPETYVLTPGATIATEGNADGSSSIARTGRVTSGGNGGSSPAGDAQSTTGDFPVAGTGPAPGDRNPSWPVVAMVAAWTGISMVIIGASRRRA